MCGQIAEQEVEIGRMDQRGEYSPQQIALRLADLGKGTVIFPKKDKMLLNHLLQQMRHKDGKMSSETS